MSTAEVNIVATLLPVKEERGILSIEIVPTKNTDSVIKEWQKDPYIWQRKSRVLQLPLDSNQKCEVKYSIKGGLNPDEDMSDGEYSLVYRDEDQTGARTTLDTSPSTESDKTYIRFTVDGTSLHSISIDNDPCETEAVSAGVAWLNVSGGATSTDDMSYDAQNLTTPKLPMSRVTPIYAVPGDVGERAMETSVTASTSGGHSQKGIQPLMAKPVAPAIGPGPSVQEGSSDEAEESDYEKLLSNISLENMAMGITPNNLRALLIRLGLKQSTLDQEKVNNPYDVVAAYYKCLLLWRSKGSKEGSTKGRYKGLFDDLIMELNEINRNDIKLVLENILREGPRNLKQDDFKY